MSIQTPIVSLQLVLKTNTATIKEVATLIYIIFV